MEVFDFFDGIKNGEISDIEILNITKRLTNDFDHEFLRTLYKDLERYIDFSENEFHSQLEKKYPDWTKYIEKEFTDKNLEVPTEKIPKLETLSKPKGDWEYHLVLDRKKIFWKDYLREFLLLLDFKKLLEKRIPPPESTETDLEKTTFPCNESEEIFNYLLDNWDNRTALKYAYILNFLRENLNFEIKPSKYKKDIQKKFDVTDVQFHNATSPKRVSELLSLYKAYRQQ